MNQVVHIIMWIFVGALVVLIVTHAQGFSTAVSAVGGQVTNDASLLAGYTPSAAPTTRSQSVNTLGGSPVPIAA